MNIIRSLKVLSTICVLFVISLITYSCHKNNKVAVAYDFSYSDSLWVGNKISFRSNAPTQSTFLWVFGDGTTSTEATPIHVYNSIPSISDPGNPDLPLIIPDTVVLIINNDTAHRIVKTLQIEPGIQRVAGLRKWRRSHVTSGGTTSLPDTSFAITITSDTLVNLSGNNLVFKTTSNAIRIGSTNWNVNPSTSYNFINSSYSQVLSYIYPSDSLVLNIRNTNDAFDYDYTVYQYP